MSLHETPEIARSFLEWTIDEVLKWLSTLSLSRDYSIQFTGECNVWGSMHGCTEHCESMLLHPRTEMSVVVKGAELMCCSPTQAAAITMHALYYFSDD